MPMGTRTERTDLTSSSAPDGAALRDAALAYLARYAATEAGLRRVLERRIDRLSRRGEQLTRALLKEHAPELHC